MAALVHPGHLRLSIGTSNASPALASRLRRDLETLFDEKFADYLDLLGRARRHVRANQTDSAKRVALLRSLVADFHVEGQLAYPDDWRERIMAVLECDLKSCGTAKNCSVCPIA